MNKAYFYRAIILSLGVVGCGSVAVVDSRSPLPDGCAYVDPVEELPDGGLDDLSAYCPGDSPRSALAACSVDVEPYDDAKCVVHPKRPELWCCPIGVWPRDENGKLKPAPEDGAGGAG